MKVVLVTSPHVRHPAVLQADFAPDPTVMYAFAPVGLLSLIAMVRRERPDITAELFDLNRSIITGTVPLNRNFYDVIARKICSRKPDVVGFMTECDSYHHVLQIVAHIRKIAPACFVVLGGPHASAVSKPTLLKCESVDAVVLNEGELTFVDLLEMIEAGRRRAVPGTLIRDASAHGRSVALIDGGPRKLIEDLDDLPIPAYDLYRPEAGEEIFLEVGRGCPFKCRFCSTAPFWSRRHRVKSVERILREIDVVQGLFGTRRVHFTHDLFTASRRWVESVCHALSLAGVPVRWTCSARADTVDEELLGLMSRAGCDAIYFGIESGSRRILRDIGKNISLEHSLQAVRTCQEVGIKANAGFIVGFPTEDPKSFRDTLLAFEQVLRLGCRPTHIFAYCPFAGSSMYVDLPMLTCDGHFVDIPLGPKVDQANRRLVQTDSDLYGAYHRPILQPLVSGEKGVVSAIDEFSPLVEAVLVPSLGLSLLLGGMDKVFSRWLVWIRNYNEARNAAEHRIRYGNVRLFATFIAYTLKHLVSAPKQIVAAAEAVQINATVADNISSRPPTTIATYRSALLPAVAYRSDLQFDTGLAAGDIIATFTTPYDVTAALTGDVTRELGDEPTHLIWQRTSGGTVRLLRVDAFTFGVIETLRHRGCGTVGDVILTQLAHDPSDSYDLDAMLESLSDAARERLVTTTELR
jgi:tRNA A37 methylthiotransferase MiaB